MRILLTGDRGYVGTVLSSILIEKEYDVVGYDIGYFADNLLTEEDHDYPKITKDIRDLEVIDLQGIDAVIHLAGLSNDPLGEFSPRLTQLILLKKLSKRVLRELFMLLLKACMVFQKPMMNWMKIIV